MGIAAAVDIEPPRAALPSRYDVLVKDTRIGACYTHVFAVYPRVTTTNSNPAARQLGPNESQRRITAMYPTHGVIWAAHCARLPRIDPAPPEPKTKLVRAETAAGEAAAGRARATRSARTSRARAARRRARSGA